MSCALRRLALLVPRLDAEQARAIMIELAPDGFEEREIGDEVELAVYADPEREAQVRAAFGQVVAEDVAPGWEDAWRTFHRPVVAGGVWIGPPWEQPPTGPSVVIDPGRAFGTGAHPTTRLCLELLGGAPVGSLLDLGCGSGVVAIAAARLGFSPVVAVDDDPVATEVTRVNAALNGVELDVRLADATSSQLPRADVAVANILLAPVTVVLERLEARLAITSGYLACERPATIRWLHCERLVSDGWAADLWAARKTG